MNVTTITTIITTQRYSYWHPPNRHHHHNADEPGKIMHVEVNDWGPEHADLRWSKPETDGGSPITGYVIEFRVRAP